jgi:hypothetical protein
MILIKRLKDLMIMMKNFEKGVPKSESSKRLPTILNFIQQNMRLYLVNLKNSTNKDMVNKRPTMPKGREKTLN